MRGIEIFIFSIFSSTVAPIFGIGGGLINVPFLTLYMGAPFVASSTAALLAGVFVSTSASIHNLRKGKVDTRTAFRLLPAFLVGSAISAYVPLSEKWLHLLFGIVALLVSYVMFAGYKIQIKIENLILSSVFLFLAGMVAGIIGISGGAILVPFLYFTQGVRGKESIATSSFMTIFGLVVSFASHLVHGDFDPTLAMPLVIPALFMGYVGAYLMMERIEKGHLRKAFAAFLLLVSIMMAGKAFGLFA